MDSIKLQEALDNEMEAVITRHADIIYKKYVIPFCEKHKYSFIAGMGSFVFIDSETGDIVHTDNEASDLPDDHREIHDYISTSGHHMQTNIADYMNDYKYDAVARNMNLHPIATQAMDIFSNVVFNNKYLSTSVTDTYEMWKENPERLGKKWGKRHWLINFETIKDIVLETLSKEDTEAESIFLESKCFTGDKRDWSPEDFFKSYEVTLEELLTH